jgi:hypothetical protein
MCKGLAYTLAIALLMPIQCWAIQDLAPAWESVSFVAGTIRLEAKAAFPSYRLNELQVWLSGKEVSLPKAEFQKITNPKLNEIRVVYVTHMPGLNHVGMPEAYIEIPFLIEDPGGTGTFNDGGAWVLYIAGGKCTHSELEPPSSP